MNILQLSDEFDTLLNDESFKALYTISFAHSSPEVLSNRREFFKTLENLPEWTKYIVDPDVASLSLGQIFDQLLPTIDVPQTWKAVDRWLDLILYSTSAFCPHITDDNANQIAMAHPLALFLFKHVETIDATCRVAMKLTSVLKYKEPPMSIIRLTSLTIRYRLFISAKMIELHKESLDDLKESREFLALFGDAVSQIEPTEESK